jgi:hypothetical protein
VTQVVRFAKRKAVWETADPIQIRDVEFRDKNGEYDLRPSAYEVEEEDIVRTFAEHAAAAPIDPPGSALSIDFEGINVKIEHRPGNDQFAFTRDRHREIVLSTRVDLEAAIQVVCANLTMRKKETSKASVYEYVSGRLEANDNEWLDLAESTSAKDWLKKLYAKRSKLGSR